MIEAVIKDVKRSLRYWNILFYLNAGLFGLTAIIGITTKIVNTPALLIQMGGMIYCYFYIRKYRKLLDTIEEAKDGPGNSGKRETEPTQPDKQA